MILRLLMILPLLLFLSACSVKSRTFSAPNKEHYLNASVIGYQNIRNWGDRTSDDIYHNAKSLRSNNSLNKRVDILALSSGGEDGAYGAGFLEGWSKRGDRPEFFMVTGVSTGALIAPFAFLGSKYDYVLKDLFTQTSKENIVTATPLSALFGGSSIGDNTPLRRRLEKVVTNDLIAEIAREGKRGRILQLGTTNLDAQRPVVWNITNIARSGRPDARKLILDIMLASSSIPGTFPPVLIDVTIDGKRYQEVHVDGAVTRQIFVYPHDMNIPKLEKKLGVHPEKKFWLIRNTKIDPEYSPVSLNISDIGDRSISTLIKYQGVCNLYNIISLAKRDGFDVHITNIPPSFNMPSKDTFDREYMRALYKVGYERGRLGQAWHNSLK
ncbi:patatin-like phospholipase family protein [Sulfurovum sp. zt1-1]|uniref:Patatin-like phospholipase family protein n=1 Tax=Sulfurovum zhangzhouensis TaxID=3019067 RepID=A0ABT7QZH3_9BACT|nr:patatin-like phospholipase family protein [Sulfurovum zhangzhouensis]